MIKALLFCLICTGLFLSSALAEDWTTTDGKTYTGVTVLKTDANFVTILDKDGGARISLINLSPDLQKRFNYNPPIQNPSAISTNDTSPIKGRPEWAQRLSQLASVLQQKQKEGGSFTSKGSVYNWNDITAIEPNALSYMLETGTGKIAFNDLPPELAKQLTLNVADSSKWDSEEMQRNQTINQTAINKQKEEQAKADAAQAQARLAAEAQQEAKAEAEQLQQAELARLKAQGWKPGQPALEGQPAAQAQQATQDAAQAQQATQDAAQAQQAAQQARAASIAALQSQIDTLLQQRLGVSESARYDTNSQSQLSDINNRISALHDQINSLKSGYH